MSEDRSHLPAILWVLLSTFIWALIFAAAKFADGRIGVFQITFLRYLGAFVVLLVFLSRQGGPRANISRQPRVHFARALCGCGAAVAITWASANMPLVDATAIGMAFGVLTMLLGAVFLKEVVSAAHWRAVVIALTGVALIMVSKGAFQSKFSFLPALVAFVSALLFAIEGLLIALLGRAEKAYTVMLYVTFFGFCLMILPAIFEWQSLPWQAFVLCILLGPAGLVAQYCTIRGYRSAPLSVVAPVDYSWLVFSALIGIVFFNEWPSAMTLLGCSAILIGGVLLVRLRRDPQG